MLQSVVSAEAGTVPLLLKLIVDLILLPLFIAVVVSIGGSWMPSSSSSTQEHPKGKAE